MCHYLGQIRIPGLLLARLTTLLAYDHSAQDLYISSLTLASHSRLCGKEQHGLVSIASLSGAPPVGEAPRLCISLPDWWALTDEASALLYAQRTLGFSSYHSFLSFYPDTYLFWIACLRIIPTLMPKRASLIISKRGVSKASTRASVERHSGQSHRSTWTFKDVGFHAHMNSFLLSSCFLFPSLHLIIPFELVLTQE